MINLLTRNNINTENTSFVIRFTGFFKEEKQMKTAKSEDVQNLQGRPSLHHNMDLDNLVIHVWKKYRK